MWDPEAAPYPAGKKLGNTIIDADGVFFKLMMGSGSLPAK